MMSELGILSLNIISDSEITLKSKNIGIIKTYLNNKNNDDDIKEDDEINTPLKPVPRRTSKRPFLSTPAILMAKNLHILLLNIKKIPNQAPTMNPIKFDKVDLYIEFLLEKLSTKKTKQEFEDGIDGNYFLKVDLNENYEEVEGEINEVSIISEVDLLLLEESFNVVKEETIKTLVSRLVKVYDNIFKEHIEVEIKRRKIFRSYVNFLFLYRKIEIYCNLYKSRVKGETIKNQTNNKIIEYSSKIKQNDINTIIRGAKRVEQLLKLSDNNFVIIDIFPHLEVNFFKSTSINVAAYECWLKIVESGNIISEEEAQRIYSEKKSEEHKRRENILKEVYEKVAALNNDDDFMYDVRGSPRYFPSDEDSPRYYPSDDDDAFLMDEDDNNN
jgi:hypothetical protein